MMNLGVLLFLLLSHSTLCATAQDGEVVFCHPGTASNPDLSSSFCITAGYYLSFSSNEPEMFFTLSVPRANGDARGWTALGMGLQSMFIFV